jgi:succinyldiaminopimelate transaminase
VTRAARLPAFPWDQLVPLKEKASLLHHGCVDLSIGTPVDPVPDVVRRALSQASDAPGYPLTAGTPELRRAAAGWLARQHGVCVPPSAILPVIGTKEFIASLPTVLGLGSGDLVAHPSLAYPTYDVGARLAGATAVAADSVVALGPARVKLMWVNSPSNPTGKVLPAPHLAKMVSWARSRGCLLASDECYISLGWDATPVSVLDPSVCGDSHDGLLSVHSLSKRSNMAGYRAGFVTGDPSLITELTLVRRHAGMMVPAPVQAAMVAALDDDASAAAQRSLYERRRSVLMSALAAAGFTVDNSEAGLYLWTTYPGLDDWGIATLLAERYGIITTPGSVYGPSGNTHVRIALTATDAGISTAATRLRTL